MKEKILIAEDEKELANVLKQILEINNYSTDVVYNGKQAIEQAKKETYELMIFDIMMPEVDGITAVEEIRKMQIDTPVVLLTAKDQIEDKVKGLDSGANDYLTKPFETKELLARIRVLTRKDNKIQKYNVGNIIFDKEESEISNDNTSLHLSHKESEIMEMLIKNKERNLTAEELSKKIWQTKEVQHDAVNMYISYLQDKFSALNANINIIENNNNYILKKEF